MVVTDKVQLFSGAAGHYIFTDKFQNLGGQAACLAHFDNLLWGS
jgi:hypothetical protein